MDNELVKEIKGTTYHFKLKSKKIIDLEKITGKNIMQILQDASMSNLARIIKYACLEECNEYDILDSLLEELSYEKLIIDFILEIAVVSGIITKSDLDRVNNYTDDEKNQ